jgi:hypothetical protein
MMGDVEKKQIQGTYFDIAMKTLALDVIQHLKFRSICRDNAISR